MKIPSLVFFMILLVGCAAKPEANPKEQPISEKETVQSLEELYPEPGFIPAGVAEHEGKRGYVANDTDGIDAIDLESGKLLWQTKAANHVLLLRGQHLIAQKAKKGNGLRVVILDVSQKGKELLVSDPIDFFGTEDRPWMFATEGHMQGKLFRLECYFSNHYLTKHLESPSMIADVNLQTGRVEKFQKKFAGPFLARTQLRGAGAWLEEKDILGVFLEPNGLGLEQRQRLPEKLQLPFEFSKTKKGSKQFLFAGKRWVAGKLLAAILDEGASRKDWTSVISWELKNGHLNQYETLSSCGGFGDWPYPSVGYHGRYLILCPSRMRNGPPPQPIKLKWDDPNNTVRIFGLETGKWIEPKPLEKDAMEPWAIGPRLFYVVPGAAKGDLPNRYFPRTLKAVDLASSKVLWERQIKPFYQ
jgi:hypothetical protein